MTLASSPSVPLRLLRVAFFFTATSTAFALSEENLNQEMDAIAGGNLIVDVAFGTVDVAAGAENKVVVEAHRKIDARADRESR